MLRICYSQRWTLCGQLAGPWVQELRSCWKRARGIVAGSGTVVDLNDVTFIDENGEALLSEMRGAGVEFVAKGIATKYLLENLNGGDEKPRRRPMQPPADGSSGKLHLPCRFGGPSFDLVTEEDAPKSLSGSRDATEREKS